MSCHCIADGDFGSESAARRSVRLQTPNRASAKDLFSQSLQCAHSLRCVCRSVERDVRDELLIVTGKIAQVSIRPKLVYLNFDKTCPDSPFTAVIFSRATNLFGDLSTLKGKAVEISGKIAEHQDKPQIVLDSANQSTSSQAVRGRTALWRASTGASGTNA
jgi:hypothetical protein